MGIDNSIPEPVFRPYLLGPVFCIVMIIPISSMVWAGNVKTPPLLVGPCEKAINLFGIKPEETINNERIGYTINYKYKDKFPSKKAFSQLYDQLAGCGWKHYYALEFVLDDVDWSRYLEGRTENETVVIHRFGRTYIDQSRSRLAMILIRYISKPSDIKEARTLDKPNNNLQLITLQFMPFNEEEYKKVLDKYR